MNPYYFNAIVSSFLFATTFFAAMIIYDFLATTIKTYIHQWEVRKYLKIQQEMEKALIIAQRNQDAYVQLFGVIAKSCKEQGIEIGLNIGGE